MSLSLDASNALEAAIDAKIKNAAAKRTRTAATVARVDTDGTVYVIVDGSTVETPASDTAAAVKPGDVVNATVANGKLSIDGNYTDPSVGTARVNRVEKTADTAVEFAAQAGQAAAAAEADAQRAHDAADNAQASADAASNSLKSVVQGATTVEKAVSVMQTALEAVVDYDPLTDTTQEWFWHDANGAHVLGDTSGYRNDIDSSGMSIKEVSSEDVVASFGSNGAQIGKSGQAHSEIDNDGLTFVSDDQLPVFSVDMAGSNTGTRPVPYQVECNYYSPSFKIWRVNSATQSDSYTIDLSDAVSGTAIALSTYRDSQYATIAGRTAQIRSAGFGETTTFSISSRTLTVNGITLDAMIQADRIYIKASNFGTMTAGTAKTISGSVENLKAFVTYQGVTYTGTFSYQMSAAYDGSGSLVVTHTTTTTWDADPTERIVPACSAYYPDVNIYIDAGLPVYSLGTRTLDTPRGVFSAIIGEDLSASSDNQTVVGKYNVADTNDTYALIIGNGTADDARSNALTVDWDGFTRQKATSGKPTRAGAAPSANTSMADMAHYDANGANIGYSAIVKTSSGSMYRSFAVVNEDSNGNSVTNALYLQAAKDGTRYSNFATDKNTTAAADVITASSGITIGSLSFYSWGQVAMLYIRATSSAAKSGTWSIGTLKEGYRPAVEAGALTGTASANGYIPTTGVVNYVGSASANANVYIKAMYILAR